MCTDSFASSHCSLKSRLKLLEISRHFLFMTVKWRLTNENRKGNFSVQALHLFLSNSREMEWRVHVLVSTTASLLHRLRLAMVYLMTEREWWELRRAPHDRSSCLFPILPLKIEVLLSLVPRLPSNGDA